MSGINILLASTVSGGIHNDVLSNISGLVAISVNGDPFRHTHKPSTISGGISNSGVISGGSIGVQVRSTSTITGGITNAGTIQGVNWAINVDNSSTLDSIHIASNTVGVSTARFIGAVSAPNTPMFIDAGATYTLRGDDQFTVSGFTNNGTARFDSAAGVTPHFDLTHVTGHTFNNNGTLGVAAGTSGTLTGNLTLANTGTFSPTVTDAGAGRVTVSGSASLAGKLYVDVKAGGATEFLTSANTYSGTVAGVLKAGTLIGTFASYDDNSTLFNFLPVYNGNQVDLTIATAGPGAIEEIVRNQGNTPGAGAATALDTIFTSNPSGPIAQLFLPLTSQQQVSHAVSQTLPLLVGSAGIAMGNAMHGVNNIVQAHQEGEYGRSSGDETIIDRHFWFKPFGSWANQDNRKGVSGYNADTYGMIFGADGELGEANRIGAAFAYSRSNVDGKSGIAPSSSDVDNYQFVVYGSHSLDDATELNAQADIGFHKTGGSRSMPLFSRVAHSDYDSWSAHLGAGISHSWKVGDRTTFTPSARADYIWMRDDSYSESGAGVLNLKVDSNTTRELILAVDGKLAHALTDKATLTANLGGGVDVIHDQSSITAAFAGAPTVAFTTKGLDPSAWMARGGLGIVGKVSDTVEVTAKYDFELRQDFDNQTASVKVRWNF